MKEVIVEMKVVMMMMMGFSLILMLLFNFFNNFLGHSLNAVEEIWMGGVTSALPASSPTLLTSHLTNLTYQPPHQPPYQPPHHPHSQPPHPPSSPTIPPTTF